MGVGRFFDNPGVRRFTDVVQTVQAVVAAVGALVLAYYAIQRSVLSRWDSALIWLVVAVLLVELVVGYLYLRYLWRPVPYDIEEAHCELIVESVGRHHRYTNTKEHLIRARRELRLVEFRAHWTGHGSRQPAIQALHGHVLLNGGHTEEDFRTYRWVYPKRAVPRGQLIRVGIRQIHEDDLDAQEPYYRDGGSGVPVRRLTVVTRFPIDQKPRVVEGRIWNSYRPTGKGRDVGGCDFVQQLNSEAGTVDYVVKVDHPRRHWSYGIRWEWPT
jgi:hypothetical protein